MSHTGQDGDDCGSSVRPCASVAHALLVSQSGDTIQLHASDAPYNHCTTGYLNTSVTLMGVGGTPVVFCDACPNCTSWPFIVRAKDVNVTLENLHFDRGDIMVENSQFTVTNCTFVNTAVYAMDAKTFAMFYSNSSASAQEFRESYLAALGYGGSLGYKDLRPCLRLKLDISSSHWKHTEQPEDQIFVDQSALNGIQVVCKSVEANIHDNFFADKNMFVSAMEQLHFSIQRSMFQGTTEGQLKVGGLEIFSFATPWVDVIDCHFERLYFSDTVLAMARSFLKLPIGALVISDESWPKFSKESHIKIINTIFRKNLRGIAVRSSMPFLNVLVSGCAFVQNEDLREGAGLASSGSTRVEITIENCTFKSNVAGVIPFERPLLNMNKVIVKYQSMKVLAYTFIKETAHVKIQQTHGKQVVLNTVTTELRGKGGGIYMHSGSLDIGTCFFEDNRANRNGGSLYSSLHSKVTVTKSTFIGPKVPVFTINGYLIASYGTIQLSNVDMTSNSPPGRASVFLHANDINSDTCEITNISVTCPINTQLETHNSSREDITAFVTERELEFLGFRMVSYDCIMCPEGEYAVGGGHFKVLYKLNQHLNADEILDISKIAHDITLRFALIFACNVI